MGEVLEFFQNFKSKYLLKIVLLVNGYWNLILEMIQSILYKNVASVLNSSVMCYS